MLREVTTAITYSLKVLRPLFNSEFNLVEGRGELTGWQVGGVHLHTHALLYYCASWCSSVCRKLSTCCTQAVS